MVNVLIIGSGGREHALAWKLKQSPKVGKIFVAPGNAGTSQIGTNVDIKATDILALAEWAEKNQINFTVVGPDDSLALGIVDEFQKRGLKIWGPSKQAARIEASKAFAKQLMKENNIPTAEYQTFTDYAKALKYLESHFKGSVPIYGLQPINRRATEPQPIVIKASGLALGKGVSVCQTLEEAKKFLQDVMVNKIFGDAGNEVVIEEFLQGPEFSIHAFSDGKSFQLLPSSQDHKAVFDDGKGPNTGGMGTIAPLSWVNEEMMKKVASDIVEPALEGLKKLGSPFVGLLYPGLMLTPLNPPSARGEIDADPPHFKGGVRGGYPKVIEFNSRFGDPETQSYMRLLKTDLLDILEACVNGTLNKINIEWEQKFACCVVLASGGYPGNYQKGLPITGVDEANKLDDIVVFHAGTTLIPPLNVRGGKGAIYTKGLPAKALATAGGRVLGVTAIAETLQSALNKAYSAIKLIHFEGMHYRTDIGQKSLLT